MPIKPTLACLLVMAIAAMPLAGTAAAQGAANANVPAKASKTCTGDRGRPAKADATWCRGGELHACNGKKGLWVNTRQKCGR